MEMELCRYTLNIVDGMEQKQTGLEMEDKS